MTVSTATAVFFTAPATTTTRTANATVTATSDHTKGRPINEVFMAWNGGATDSAIVLLFTIGIPLSSSPSQPRCLCAQRKTGVGRVVVRAQCEWTPRDERGQRVPRRRRPACFR